MIQKPDNFLAQLDAFVRPSLVKERHFYNLPEASSKFEVGEDLFSRWMKEDYGRGYGQFVNWVRVNQAGILLRSGAFETVREVYTILRYHSHETFRRSFLQYYPCCPQDYLRIFDLQQGDEKYRLWNGMPYQICRHCGEIKPL